MYINKLPRLARNITPTVITLNSSTMAQKMLDSRGRLNKTYAKINPSKFTDYTNNRICPYYLKIICTFVLSPFSLDNNKIL
jgi:hypothetical protein